MLTRKKCDALKSLLMCSSVTEAASDCGIAPSTMTRYLKDPEFVKEYNDRRTDTLRECCRKLENARTHAIDKLIEMIDLPEDKIPESIRLQAINSLLSHSIDIRNWTETNDRISEIEQIVKERDENNA